MERFDNSSANETKSIVIAENDASLMYTVVALIGAAIAIRLQRSGDSDLAVFRDPAEARRVYGEQIAYAGVEVETDPNVSLQFLYGTVEDDLNPRVSQRTWFLHRLSELVGSPFGIRLPSGKLAMHQRTVLMLGLDPIDEAILALTLLVNDTDSAFCCQEGRRDRAPLELSPEAVSQLLATLTGLPKDDILDRLSSTSGLLRILGLKNLSDIERRTLAHRLEMSQSFTRILASLLRPMAGLTVNEPSPSEEALADLEFWFPHMANVTQHVLKSLNVTTRHRARGINYCFRGSPDETSRYIELLCGAAGVWAVKAKGIQRLLAEQIFRERNDIVILTTHETTVSRDFRIPGFPEFSDYGSRKRSKKAAKRAKSRRTNAIPYIWTLPRSSCPVAAPDHYLLELTLPEPPPETRLSRLNRIVPHSKSDAATLEELAYGDHSWSAISEALAFAESTDSASSTAFWEAVHVVLISKGRQEKPTTSSENTPIPTTDSFRQEFINWEGPPVDTLLRALQSGKPARIALYGPPGTGKTAFARHVAQTLGVSLTRITPADILDKWVGESEVKIAKLFEGAKEEKSVLFFDEADGLLRDRYYADHGWQVTQANELLARLEEFPGVFICATNHFNSFDSALMRRFHFKCRLNYLDQNQSIAMLADSLGIERNLFKQDEGVVRSISELRNLTPSDFVNVREKCEFLDLTPSPTDFVRMLAEECCAKKEIEAYRTIGF